MLQLLENQYATFRYCAFSLLCFLYQRMILFRTKLEVYFSQSGPQLHSLNVSSKVSPA